MASADSMTLVPHLMFLSPGLTLHSCHRDSSLMTNTHRAKNTFTATIGGTNSMPRMKMSRKKRHEMERGPAPAQRQLANCSDIIRMAEKKSMLLSAPMRCPYSPIPYSICPCGSSTNAATHTQTIHLVNGFLLLFRFSANIARSFVRSDPRMISYFYCTIVASGGLPFQFEFFLYVSILLQHKFYFSLPIDK